MRERETDRAPLRWRAGALSWHDPSTSMPTQYTSTLQEQSSLTDRAMQRDWEQAMGRQGAATGEGVGTGRQVRTNECSVCLCVCACVCVRACVRACARMRVWCVIECLSVCACVCGV